jgi:hypothetical protein
MVDRPCHFFTTKPSLAYRHDDSPVAYENWKTIHLLGKIESAEYDDPDEKKQWHSLIMIIYSVGVSTKG